MIKVLNKGSRVDLVLNHDVVCTSSSCFCKKATTVRWEDGKDGSRGRRDGFMKVAGSFTLLSQSKTDLPNSFEKLPQVQGLLASGQLKVLERDSLVGAPAPSAPAPKAAPKAKAPAAPAGPAAPAAESPKAPAKKPAK